MTTTDTLEVRSNHIYFYPANRQNLNDYIPLIKQIIALSAQSNTYALLANVSAVAQKPPTTGAVFSFLVSLMTFWNRQIRVAVVDSFGWLQLDSFPLTVAMNRGMQVVLFSSEEEALHWLVPPSSVPIANLSQAAHVSV